MSIEEIAKHFGLPGFMLLIWYLIERGKNARIEKAEDERMKVENKKVDAMTVGFQALASKLDDHTTLDLEHHGKVREAVVALNSKVDTLIDMGDRFTPPPQDMPRPPRARTNPEGVPAATGTIPGGTYGPRRGGRDGG